MTLADARCPEAVSYTHLIHAQAAGIFKNVRVIGDIVEAGDTLAEIWQEDGTKLLVQTQITGILRGLLRDGYLLSLIHI